MPLIQLSLFYRFVFPVKQITSLRNRTGFKEEAYNMNPTIANRTLQKKLAQKWLDQSRLLSSSQANLVHLSQAVAKYRKIRLNHISAADDLRSNEILGLFEDRSLPLILILIDGFGVSSLKHLDESGFMAQQNYEVLHSVFPSATTAALTSLASGKWPGEHGCLGWWTYLPEFKCNSVPLPFIDRKTEDCLSQHGIAPEMVFPSILKPDIESESSSMFYYPRAIAGSKYSLFLGQESSIIPYTSLEEGVDRLIASFNSQGNPDFSYLYYPNLDSISHKFGMSSQESKLCVRGIDKQIESLYQTENVYRHNKGSNFFI